MTTLVSPGVAVREIDLTTIIPAVSTTEGVIAGIFHWGPLEKRILVDSESDLVKKLGKPSNLNAETWYTGAGFLSYGNKLYVTRAGNTAGPTPTATVAVEEANTTVVLEANTTTGLGLAEGMYVISSSNSGISVGAYITNIVNSTAFEINTSTNALANTTNDEVQFVSNTLYSAVSNTGPVANLEYQTILNEDDFANKDGTFDADVLFVARYPGAMGNSLRVSVCGNSSGYHSSVNLASFGANVSFEVGVNSNTTTVNIVSSNGTAAAANATAIQALFNVTDNIEVGNNLIGYQYMKVTSLGTTVTDGANASFTISFEDQFKLSANHTFDSANTTTRAVPRYWEYFNLVDTSPGQSDYNLNFGNTSINSDEMHVVVVDDGGKFTGVPGTVLEVYRNVSRGTDSKTVDGASNHWRTVLNDASQYVYAVNDISTATSALSENLVSSTLDVGNYTFNLGKDGKDETNIELSVLLRAYDFYQSAEDVDISLVMQGKARSFTLANYLIDNIAEKRKDCVVFVSPQRGDVINNVGNEHDAIVNFRNNIRSTSYAMMDSGYKYIYDRYNDIYRWVPLNGDIAGLCVRTDMTNDAWWSPAGFNRGQIKNVIRLAYNPRQAHRDVLYKAGVNPVVTFPGEGTYLYGDKTLLAKPSAFDRINVRRLFIVLEKAISRASKYTLFEFNDAFTRSQFKNLVVPYLRDVQARRGIYDFYVVCDETNNTPEVIDRNEFIGDIYIKPARSINFITLNFIAVRTGVAFSEIVRNW